MDSGCRENWSIVEVNDVDADGIWDAGEPRLQGWVIQLDIGRDGKVDRTTTTDANGDYVFGDLAAGKYYVSEIQQPGWDRIYPVESAHPVTLTVGQNMTGINFGNHQDCEGNISWIWWHQLRRYFSSKML